MILRQGAKAILAAGFFFTPVSYQLHFADQQQDPNCDQHCRAQASLESVHIIEEKAVLYGVRDSGKQREDAVGRKADHQSFG